MTTNSSQILLCLVRSPAPEPPCLSGTVRCLAVGMSPRSLQLVPGVPSAAAMLSGADCHHGFSLLTSNLLKCCNRNSASMPCSPGRERWPAQPVVLSLLALWAR